MDFLLYAANLDASVATRSKISANQVRKAKQQTVRCRRTIDEGVQDRHRTVGDTGIGVNLLQNWMGRVSKVPATELGGKYGRDTGLGRTTQKRRDLGPRSN